MPSSTPADISTAPDLIRETSRGTVEPKPYGDGSSIRLGNGYFFDPVNQGEPDLPAELRAAPGGPGGIGSYLVQFKGPIGAADREELEAAGATLFAYLPNYTYLVRLPAGKRAAVDALTSVRWTGPFHPAYKLSSLPEMSLAGAGTFVVLLFKDADLAVEQAAVETLGGTVLEATDSGRNKIMKVALDQSRLADLAARNDVAWIEPFYQAYTGNASCQWVVQTNVTNNRRVWDMGLRGEGQVVHMSDSGIRTSHNAFRDSSVPITNFGQFPAHRKIIAYKPSVPGMLFGDTGGASYHGTHTAGTVAGDDSPFAADARDGMALKAKIWFHDAGTNANAIFTPGDLNLLFQPPYTGNGGGAARISSNSWGSNAMGAYTVSSMTTDQFMWDHQDFLVNFSCGNEGPVPASVGSPATMKNGVSSGAVQNGSNSGLITDFSSQGPAADGRQKPTIVSPGQSIQSANGIGDTGYKSLSGTSMSCPSGAGAIALIRQYLTEGWYPTGAATPANVFNPSGPLLKAMAIASTDNDMAGQSIPNHIVGWGRIKVDNILFFPGDAAMTALVDQTEGLGTGDFVEYEIEVAGSAVPFKIALCWFDREGSPASARQLVNDLNLSVTDPLDVPFVGNVFAGGESAPGGVPDSLNVEECVRRNLPTAGTWTIRVSAANVPFGPQPFALAVSGQLGAGSGVVRLDRVRYGQADMVQIRVEDVNATSPVTVQVASSTEATPENVTLSGSDGVFTGTIATTAQPAGADGDLSVSHGDAISVAYSDDNPAATSTATATADFTGPVITEVAGSGGDVSHMVTWTTDVSASSRVHYGATPALGQSTALDGELVTSHAAILSGLTPETTYYFDVESADQTGNLTRDDAGGQHYSFSTGKSGDILLVIGDDSFPLEDHYMSAFTAYGWDASLLKGGTVTDPLVGDRSSGLRSYTAVLWQVGYEQYPPVPDAARDSITAYLDGGGRFTICGHDIGWAFTDPTSGFSTPARIAWINNSLHFRYLADPATWSANLGVAGDPISGDYTTGVLYDPQRDGGAGDEVQIVAGTGTGNYIWTDTDATIDNIALRWQNNVDNGNPADAVWGGTPTRVVSNCYEWAQIVDRAAREDILDRTLVWLIGHDHPDAGVTSPNGGEVVTGSSVDIAWTETAYGGASVGSRSLYYTADGGASWQLITASAGPSPYAWDVSGLPNSPSYRVRVEIRDDTSPALRGSDASDADFTIERPGGDTRGPAVVAGSIKADPNPMDNRNDATLFATISDVAYGNSNVAAAEWSNGPAPAPPGSGHPMYGDFNAPAVDVSAVIPALTVSSGTQKFWVRGRDAQGSWGGATAQEFTVNGESVSGVKDGLPASRFFLGQNVPNPFRPWSAISFNLPEAGYAELGIFDVQGRKVKTLLAGPSGAGPGTVVWDGRSDSGEIAPGGVYFYRLIAGIHRATKKMVLSR